MQAIGYALLAVAGGLAWRNGPELPVPVGGHAAGVAGGRLVVAGGTTWQGGTKRWLSEVWALDSKSGAWERVGELPEAVGDGVGISAPEGLYLLGGSDGRNASATCRRLRLDEGKLILDVLPDLPERRVYASGARVGRTLYVIGGCPDPAHLETATATLYALDADRPGSGWKRLAALPGKARCVHAAVECGGALYVFGGAYVSDKGGVENLADGYRYLPARGRWERIPDMPAANRGLTLTSDGKERILLLGGYTATAAESEGKPDDFGFTGDVLRYDVRAKRYAPAGVLPVATVGAVPVPLAGDLYLVGGEPVKRQRGAWTWVLPSPRR